jgi:hypothetical protein
MHQKKFDGSTIIACFHMPVKTGMERALCTWAKCWIPGSRYPGLDPRLPGMTTSN